MHSTRADMMPNGQWALPMLTLVGKMPPSMPHPYGYANRTRAGMVDNQKATWF